MTAAGTEVRPPDAREPVGPGRTGRAVRLAGLVLGTAVVIALYWEGWHPRIGGMPAVLGYLVAFAIAVAVAVALATVAAELVRRRHRAVAARAGRQGKRAAMTGARAAGSGYRRAARWAGTRWQDRHGIGASDDGASDDTTAGGDWPGPDAERIVSTDPAGALVPAVTEGNGERPMTAQQVPNAGTRTGAPPRTARTRLPDRVKANAPGEWRALAAATSDHEPESDEELLDWMASQVAGISTYGEALADVYETCVESVRLDPVAMAALHDVADASADFASAMAYARQKFASHYAEIREFVADGGVLPKDGDFITGEGDD